VPKRKIAICKHALVLFLILLVSDCLPFIRNKPVHAISCRYDDVVYALSLVQTGGTLLIPSGQSEWPAALEIPDDKKIEIRGEGQEKTIITSNIPTSCIDLNTSGSRLTNMGFVLENNDGVGIDVRGQGWRIDHCRFVNDNPFIIEAVWANNNSDDGSPVGLVDHCEFLNTRCIAYGSNALMANDVWAQPLGLGTNNAMFIEDCAFTYTEFSNAVDANYGGRYVFRHNTVTDAYVEAHAVQGKNRSVRSWEIYDNIIRQKNRSMWVPFFMRGGTGVIFNNVVEGEWTIAGIAVDYRRACEYFAVPGWADGTSPWDGNSVPGVSAYPARDQIGRSTDSFLWVDSDSDGDFNDESIPSQALDPAYCWNNKHNGENVVFFEHSCVVSQDLYQENRDYYNNVQRPGGYTPYTYPHPLIAEWDNR